MSESLHWAKIKFMFGIAFCLVEILYADKMLLAKNKELSFCHRTMFTIKKKKILTYVNELNGLL